MFSQINTAFLKSPIELFFIKKFNFEKAVSYLMRIEESVCELALSVINKKKEIIRFRNYKKLIGKKKFF